MNYTLQINNELIAKYNNKRDAIIEAKVLAEDMLVTDQICITNNEDSVVYSNKGKML